MEISALQASVVPRYLKATLRSLWGKGDTSGFVGWSDIQLCPRLPAKPQMGSLASCSPTAPFKPC